MWMYIPKSEIRERKVTLLTVTEKENGRIEVIYKTKRNQPNKLMLSDRVTIKLGNEQEDEELS